MKTVKECWNIPLIVVNVSIASLGMVQICLAVSLRHTLESSSDILKYERKIETILMVCAGLFSFFVGFYGICISYMYVPFFLITYVVMLIMALGFQVPICVVSLYSLKGDVISEHSFQDSNRMIRDNKPPQGLIFLQKNLYCCGFEGFSDYKTLPSSCCKNQKSCEFGAGDLYMSGCLRAMGKYLEPFAIVIGVLLIHHVVFVVIGILGAIYQIHHIKREIEYKKFRYPEAKDQIVLKPGREPLKKRNIPYFAHGELIRDSGRGPFKETSLAASSRSTKNFEARRDRYPSEEWIDEGGEVENPKYKGNSKQSRKSQDSKKSEVIKPISDDLVESYLKNIDPANILNTGTTLEDEKVKNSSPRKSKKTSTRKSGAVTDERKKSEEENLNAPSTERTRHNIDINKAIFPRLSKIDSTSKPTMIESSQTTANKDLQTKRNTGTEPKTSQTEHTIRESTSSKKNVAITPIVVAPPNSRDESSQTTSRKNSEASTAKRSVQQRAVNRTNPNNATSQRNSQPSDVNKLPSAAKVGIGNSSKASGSPIDKTRVSTHFKGSAQLDKSAVESGNKQVQPTAEK